jgi:predicted DNA-binding transcriptional regulator AlpA
MTTNSDILYVPDLARKLGRTESAIRTAVNRGANWLPPAFSMGRRLAWRAVDVDRFLAEQAQRTGR